MSLETLATAIMILAGTCVMGVALLDTRRMLALVARGQFAPRWRALFLLTGFFLVGYVACLVLALTGRTRILTLLTGVIFLGGAAFVYLVVHVGRQTVQDLMATTVSRTNFARTLETMPDALIVLGPDLAVRMVNQAATELSGYSREELIGEPAARVFSDCDMFTRPKELLGGASGGKVEKDCRTRDGRNITVAFSWSMMRSVDGDPDGVVCLVQDISERRLSEQALRDSREALMHSATHDDLTGLPNRALIVDRIDRVVEQAHRRPGQHFAVLFLDLDRFKTINDSLGHAAGDELVKQVARILVDCVRAVDTVGRLGGDEFVILLEEIRDVRDAVRVVERIERSIAAPLDIFGHELFVKVSVGIVLSDTGYASTGDVLRDADIAMYRAKAGGGNRFEIFDATMRERMAGRLQIETALRHALERDEFEIHYQPIVALSTGRMAGLEALLRWRHPERGLVPPLEFIPLAEETGMIVEIDRWVLRTACSQLREWQRAFPDQSDLTVSVNLSSAQFRQPDLESFVSGVLQETGLSSASLKLEITEGTFIEDVEQTTSTLLGLRDLGVRTEIDDFGTGYSSLSYLHRLPIDAIKIDQSFVRNMSESGTDLAIVHTILLMAQALDIRAVAEGVETEEQRAQLEELRCDYAQGYLFSRPLPAAAILDRFAQASIDPASGQTPLILRGTRTSE